MSYVLFFPFFLLFLFFLQIRFFSYGAKGREEEIEIVSLVIDVDWVNRGGGVMYDSLHFSFFLSILSTILPYDFIRNG